MSPVLLTRYTSGGCLIGLFQLDLKLLIFHGIAQGPESITTLLNDHGVKRRSFWDDLGILLYPESLC